jgi:nucleotide-binding universal stress UspA family protein
MSAEIIVSYDGTPNDDDALALARTFLPTGASLALAYVRHSREFDPSREQLAQHDAERRLEQGAAWLDQPSLPRHVVISASTGEGLAELAEREGASVVVFGSDYRTAPGHVEPGTTAQHFLEGGTVAVAVALAGIRTRPEAKLDSIAVLAEEDGGAAAQTADLLAAKLGATVTGHDGDLIVVGSQPTAPEGRVTLSGATRSQLGVVRSSVLVVPRGKPVRF